VFIGHYGLAFAARRAAPRASLGSLFFAAQLLDFLWPIFLMLGLEHVRVQKGLMAASPLDLYDYPWSHSLATAALWGVLFAALYFARARDRRGALVLGALVVSHWVLDLIMHRPDLPLWPGGSLYLGFGAWNSVPLTLALESTFYVAGVWLYLRATRAKDAAGVYGLWVLVFLLPGLFVMSLIAEPPPPRQLQWGWLFTGATFAWAYWVDRHRELRLE
jgi:hypothetical protein